MNVPYCTNPMRRILIALPLMLPVMLPLSATAQTSTAQTHAAQTSTAQTSAEKEWRTLEKRTQRSTYRFVGEAVQQALQEPLDAQSTTLVLVVKENGVRRLCIELPATLRQQYRDGQLTLQQVYAAMPMSNDTHEAVLALQQAPASAPRDAWRPELVFYPQLKLQNSGFHALYTYAVNIAPAVEMNLWPGARATAQVIFPIATNLHGMYRRIRPGVLALEQRFEFGSHWHGHLAAGNFTHERLGGQGALWWRNATGRWEIGVEGGATVESMVLPTYGWRISNQVRYNVHLNVQTYVPQVNCWLKASGGRFLYGDWGVRGELVRAFGEHTIGIYGIYSEGEGNLGFTFSVPLPTKRYPENRGIRVRAAEYFGLEYSMRSWGKFIDNKLGRTYSVQPYRSYTQQCWQPDYIRYYLEKTAK